ncbi:MAG: isopeptide-forming domain-containing fimbrial protein [Flavobacteriaceae bacterium]|nr:isopeptide-forming domain-containing fimbrial protein [Flavobacteriaceae bacterium]
MKKHLFTIKKILCTLFLVFGFNLLLFAQNSHSGISANGKFRVTKTADVFTVPSGGGEVSYSYQVKNISNQRLYYVSGNDDKCSPMELENGLSRTYSYLANRWIYYLSPGATATWECSEYISETTTNTATFKFAESYSSFRRFQWTGTSTGKASVTVERELPNQGDITCSGLWFGGDRDDNNGLLGKVGTLSLQGNATAVFDIRQQTNNRNKVGTAAMAVDPHDPTLIYYIPRSEYSAGNVTYGGLYVYDTDTGSSRYLNSFPSTDSHYVRMGIGPNGLVWVINSAGNARSFNPVSGSWTNRGQVRLPSNFDWSRMQSGDIAFDGNGTMYIIASVNNSRDSDVGYLFTLTQSQLLSGSPNALLVGQMGNKEFNGIAFTEDGKLWASNRSGSRSYLYEVNKATGVATLVSQITGFNGVNVSDLGSCALPMADLDLQKTVSPEEAVNPGETLTYTIRACNTGSLIATDVYLRDAIPAGTTYLRGSTKLNGTTMQDINGQMPFATSKQINSPNSQNGRIAAGSCATIEFKVIVQQLQGEICNQASITYTGSNGELLSDNPELPGGNDLTCRDIIPPSPTLSILKNSLPTNPVTIGDTIHYEIVVGNPGTVEARFIEITDTLPAGVDYVPNSARKTYRITSGTNRIQTTDDANAPLLMVAAEEEINLMPNESMTITFDAIVNATVTDGQILENIATAQAQGMSEPISDNAFNEVIMREYSISGTVFYDQNRLTDNTVNGIPFSPKGGIYAVLVDTAGHVMATSLVNSRYHSSPGTYHFSDVIGGRQYRVILRKQAPVVGEVINAAILPNAYFSTGENIGAGPGSDGTIDSQSAVFMLNANITDVNFGLYFFEPFTEA